MNLNNAIKIAFEHHDGQFDKGGKPYILHPLYVMSKVKTEEEKIVAILHDVIEDTQYTFDDLKKDGFNENIITALTTLTHEKAQIISIISIIL